jgi:uridine kinase
MNTEARPKLIAIAGGSGSGKSWLADRLQSKFGTDAARLSLDDFYHDLQNMPRSQRQRVNFDDPEAVDWIRFEAVLRDGPEGRAVFLPRYDFSTHTRRPQDEPWTHRPLVFVDGLWLLQRPSVRALFDLRVFLDCPENIRWRRRLARDVAERGRTPDSVREQFWNTVAPMHDSWVAPQVLWADVVLSEPHDSASFDQLVGQIRGLLREPALKFSGTAARLSAQNQVIDL